MKFLHKFAFAAVLLFIIFFSGCNPDRKYDTEFFAMNTVMTITAYGGNAENAVKECESEINRLDSLLSVQNKNSEVYKLNRDKSLDVSSDLLNLIRRAKEAYSLTDGAFDITTEPLTEAWGFYSWLENRVPSQKEINSALKLVGSEKIKITDNTVTLEGGSSIDSGGIAKGYSSAKAAQIISDNDVSSAIISLGGNVRAVGKKPDGSLWNVAIADPDKSSEQIGTVKVCDKAVVTSGGYQRFFEENGKTYHHIINPENGYPANSGLKSVTIVSEDDCLADALSTALFVMGLDNAAQLYRDNRDLFGAVFVDDSGVVYVTDNLSDCYFSQRSFEVIK